MTEEQSKDWFEKNPVCYKQIVIGMYETVKTEELYQAFRARLLSELNRK